MLARILLLLIGTACDLLTAALLARFAMQAMRISFRSQLGQFLLAATNWAVVPARRLIPAISGYDTASLLLAWLSQIVYLGLLAGLTTGMTEVTLNAMLTIAIVALFETLKIALYMAMGIVLISAVFSWVNPHAPMAYLFDQLSAPMLRPFRRFIPPLGGVDLSPIVLLLAIQILLMVLADLRVSLLVGLHG